MGATPPPSSKKMLYLRECKNECIRFVLSLFNVCSALEKYYYVSILLNISMSTGAAKLIQNESFQGNSFSRHDVNRGSLVSSCSSLGFSAD